MLIRCSECGEQISDQAEACPHCGAPVQAEQELTLHDETLSVSRRFRGIVLFSSLAIVFMDIVLYIIGRLVLMPMVKSAVPSYSTSLAAVPWHKFMALVMVERDLTVVAGGIVVLIVGVLLSWMFLRVLHLDQARRSTQLLLGCFISGGIIVTLLATWAFWARAYLPLPSSLYPEFPPSWGGWVSLPLRNGIPVYPPDQSRLVPVVSLGFLILTLIVAALRAAYLRLFEKQHQ